MRLYGKRIALVVTDGIDYREYTRWRDMFENECAEILLTAPGDRVFVESMGGNRRERDIVIDIPLAEVHPGDFAAMAVPVSGGIAEELVRGDGEVKRKVDEFSRAGYPIFASTHASQVLHVGEGLVVIDEMGEDVMERVLYVLQSLSPVPLQAFSRLA